MLQIRHLHKQKYRQNLFLPYYLALICCCFMQTTNAQMRRHHCLFDESQRAKIPQPTAADLEEYRLRFPPCNSPTATKNVRVNVHFMLDDAGGNNFLPHEDGYGNPNYTGFTFAEEMIEKANVIWGHQDAGDYGVWLYNGTANKFVPMRVRLLLTGVYWHKSNYWNTNDNGNFSINALYGVNTLNTINIYILNQPSLGGMAGFQNGAATKMMDCWFKYGQYPSWGSAYAADLLNHEIGHLCGLTYHDYENTNVAPYWGDYCEDTPDHPNCWSIYDSDPVICLNNWSVQSNNMMSYSEHPAALSPCQIDTIHNKLSNGYMQNYVHSCAGCLPANTFYTINPQFCARAKVGGGYFPVDVPLDGRGSFNEDSYLIEIFEVSASGSNVILGNHFMQQYNGQLGQINLRTFCNYNFEVGKNYRVKVSTSKTACLPSSEQTQWIAVSPCMPDTTTTTPTVPIKKSLTILPRQPKSYILHSTLEQQAQIYVYDFMGRVLYQQPKTALQAGDNILDLNNLETLLPNNFYILAVQTADGIETQRFFIP